MFTFRLMDHFRIPTLSQFSAQLTVDDSLWWEAYVSIEGPLGAKRGDLRAASICQIVAACHGNKGDLSDYVLTWQPRRESTWEDLWGYFSGIQAGQINKRGVDT